MSAGVFVHSAVGQSVSRSVGQLVSRSVGQSVSRSVGQSVSQSAPHSQPRSACALTPQVNPELKDAKALIDDSADFAGYKAVGFNVLLGEKTLETPPDFKPPKAMSAAACSEWSSAR